jgi:hypothetical protein
MGLLGSIFKVLTGGLLGAALTTKPRPPVIPPQPTRDDARKQMLDQDALLRRRGAAADILTGTSGAEAPAGATGRLIVGS